MTATSPNADIVFQCPRCRGPLMVGGGSIGASLDCPHCLEAIEVPAGRVVNKDVFEEPRGLRRLLTTVRDREWEIQRRKLQQAKSRVTELEEKLRAEPAEKSASDAQLLRKQVADLSEKFVQANQSFTAGRRQHEAALEQLRREAESAREEQRAAAKKSAELATALNAALAELDRLRAKPPQPGADRETPGEAQGGIAALRKALEETQARLDAEQAKVFLMEAASIAAPAPRSAKASAGEPCRRDRLIADLQAHVRKLHETNETIRAARDQACEEAQRLAQKLGERETEDDVFEAALSKVSVDLNEIGRMIARKRGSGGTPLLL